MNYESDESRRIPRRQALKALGLGGAFALLESACGVEEAPKFQFPEGRELSIGDLNRQLPQLITEIRKFPEVRMNFIRSTGKFEPALVPKPFVALAGNTGLGFVTMARVKEDDLEFNFDLKDDALSDPTDFTNSSNPSFLITIDDNNRGITRGERTRGPVRKGKTSDKGGLNMVYPGTFKGDTEVALFFNYGLFKNNKSAAFLPYRFRFTVLQNSPLSA